MPAYIPSDYGNIGDIYIDVVTGDFYGPKTVDGWPDTPFFTALTSLTVDEAVLNDRYIHSQPVASSEWVVTHALGGRPSVTVVDSAATKVYGEIVYDSDTQITIKFSAPFSGYAYLT
jgi:hypothetical protein